MIGGINRFRNGLSQWRTMAVNFGSLRSLNAGVGLDDPLIIGGWFPSRPAPGPFDNFPLADVLRGDQGGIVIRT